MIRVPFLALRATRRVTPHAIVAAALLACSASAALAQTAGEPVTTRRATELRDAPRDTGRSIAPLPAQTSVTRLAERQGPWVQVRTATGATGWVHMFDVGPAGQAEPQSGGGSGVLRGVTGFFNRSPQPMSTPTSTIGIRGLGAEDIARAQPNVQAVQQMESLRQNDAEARDFANRAQLMSNNVEPLPVPRGGADGGTPGGRQ